MAGFAAVVDIAALASDGSDGFIIDGQAASDGLGASVASAGDVNGDGIDDFIVAAPSNDAGGGGAGASYVVFGTASGFPVDFDVATLDGTNGFRISGSVGQAIGGLAVAGAGDVNGDGIDDLLVGLAYGLVDGGAAVVFGRNTAVDGDFAASLSLSGLNGSNGFWIAGEGGSNEQRLSIASAGDINGDGIDDVVIGTAYADPHGTSSGAAFVVFGRDTASAGTFDASVALSALDGTDGFQINGVQAGWLTGFSVASAGDVNGDGIDDLIIGARNARGLGRGSAGISYVVFGKDTAVNGGFGANFELSSLDGSNGFLIVGGAAGDYSGWSVASAGDINGDGLTDLIVGAIGADPHGAYSGASYVVFGKNTAVAGAFALTLDLAALNGTDGFKISGAAAGNRSGSSVASAGDVNGDGIDDLIIGAPNTGAAYVVYGRNTAVDGGFQANIDLSSLDGLEGFKVAGVSGAGAGGSVASAGDIDQDGFDDLIIGARSADGNGTDAGSAYVIYGRSNVVTFTGTGAADNQNGAAAGDSLSGLAGDDTLTGLGGADHLDGGDGNDFLYGGTAGDTLDGGNNGDWLDGGTGADAMTGGAGDDSFIVDDAGDTTVEAGGGGVDVVYTTVAWILGANIEKLILDGSADIDGYGNSLANVITGNGGANRIEAGDGDDLVKAGGGDDAILGGLGADQLLGQDGADNINGEDGNDRLDGGNGDDGLLGGAGADILDGGAGVDILWGGAGNDQLNGGSESDTLRGEDGNDVLNGGLGADTMAGGLGDDTFYVDDTGDLIGEVVGEGTDTIRAGVSYTIANNVENLVQEGSGNIDAVGNSLANAITGNGGANSLDGGAGDDVIKAGLGNDILTGGIGNDVLVGGGGTDTFVVAQASIHISGAIEVDTVNDLIAAQGDRLDLSAIDADSLTAGDQGFHLVGSFSHHAAEMTLTFAAGVTVLNLDVNGDGRSDYRMTISGNVTGDSGGWLL